MVATAADFIFTIFAVEAFNLIYPVATTLGAIAGALVNFMVNRYWSFQSTNNSIGMQGARYVIVWLGSVSINVYASNFIVKYFCFPYIASKVIVSFLVGITFNYLLQKHFVFKNSEKIS